MNNTMKRFGYFFFSLMLFAVTIKILAKDQDIPKFASIESQLPDEDTTVLNEVLSAIGGFSGGGLFLIFLIRRLVNSYDESFAKWENRCSGHSQRQDEKNGKMINMIEEIHEMAQDLKVEIIKLQVNAIDKDSVTEAFTKVGMLEDDVTQMKDEIKSIMVHLISKPKSTRS